MAPWASIDCLLNALNIQNYHNIDYNMDIILRYKYRQSNWMALWASVDCRVVYLIIKYRKSNWNVKFPGPLQW